MLKAKRIFVSSRLLNSRGKKKKKKARLVWSGRAKVGEQSRSGWTGKAPGGAVTGHHQARATCQSPRELKDKLKTPGHFRGGRSLSCSHSVPGGRPHCLAQGVRAHHVPPPPPLYPCVPPLPTPSALSGSSLIFVSGCSGGQVRPQGSMPVPGVGRGRALPPPWDCLLCAL